MLTQNGRRQLQRHLTSKVERTATVETLTALSEISLKDLEIATKLLRVSVNSSVLSVNIILNMSIIKCDTPFTLNDF